MIVVIIACLVADELYSETYKFISNIIVIIIACLLTDLLYSETYKFISDLLYWMGTLGQHRQKIFVVVAGSGVNQQCFNSLWEGEHKEVAIILCGHRTQQIMSSLWLRHISFASPEDQTNIIINKSW